MSTQLNGNTSTEIINNLTISATGSYGTNINVAGCTRVELLATVGTKTGANTIVFNILVIEAVSGNTISTYSATAISASNGTATIVIDPVATNNILGDTIQVTWTVGASTSFANTYCRLITKVR